MKAQQPVEVVDLTQDTPPLKRKRVVAESSSQCQDTTYEDIAAPTQKKARKTAADGEKRLKRWRASPPLSYLEVKSRALTQRMFALDRQRHSAGSEEYPIETVSLAGTTGNVYTIIIDRLPSCNCPHARKGNQCKHICYVLSRILRVRAELEYQLAFTTSELREIFANAPPLPSQTTQNENGNRKPIEGECPICMVDLDADSGESIVYCKAACGNNIHKTCFDQWAASKGHAAVSCPFCRTPWEGDASEAQNLARKGTVNEEGYVNVASQLGLSGRRDYSSYHSYWVQDQVRRGEVYWDDDGVMDHGESWRY